MRVPVIAVTLFYVMQHSIAFNASFFCTERRVQPYVLNAYIH